MGHHHRPRPEETVNFKAVYDADLIANLEEKLKEQPITSDRIKELLAKSFLTDGGREEAKKVFGV